LSLCAEVEATEKRWRVLLNYLPADWLPLTNKKAELKAVDLDALDHHYTGNLQADKFKVACADSNKQNSSFHSCCVHDSYLAVRLSLICHKLGTLFYYDN
jgi:hypothetical protein